MVIKIEVKLSGDKDFANTLKTLRIKLPIHMDRGAKKIATKIKRESQRNVDARFIQKSGKLRKSIITRPLTKRKEIVAYKTAPDLRIARYATIQEAGKIISGWHFVRREGFGKHGEGYSARGGQIRIPARHFMRDAFNKVQPQAKQIMQKEIDKWVLDSQKKVTAL